MPKYLMAKIVRVHITIVRFGYRLAYHAWRFFKRYCFSQTAGAQVIVWSDKKVLLVKSCYRDTFTFPGGYINRQESPRDAAVRELFEETGLCVPPKMLRFYQCFTSIDYRTNCSDYMFLHEYCESGRLPIEPDGKEIIVAKFFDIEQIESLPIDYNVRRYLNQYEREQKILKCNEIFAKCKAN